MSFFRCRAIAIKFCLLHVFLNIKDLRFGGRTAGPGGSLKHAFAVTQSVHLALSLFALVIITVMTNVETYLVWSHEAHQTLGIRLLGRQHYCWKAH